VQFLPDAAPPVAVLGRPVLASRVDTGHGAARLTSRHGGFPRIADPLVAAADDPASHAAGKGAGRP
jgi:hypothetical protein